MEEDKQAAVKKSDSGSGPDQNEKNITLLSYLFLLFLVPLLAKRDSKFAQYHAKQGLVLTIVWFIAPFTIFLAPFVYLFCVVMVVIGIMNVMSGKMEPLPLIGKIAEKFDF